MERLEVCLLCGAEADRAKTVCRRDREGLVRCPSCGLLYVNPQPAAAELAELYDRLYYRESVLFEGSEPEREHARNRVLYRTVLRDLLSRYPRLSPRKSGGLSRVLDFGCGPGYFLVECRDLGFQVSGIEFSAPAARYAREKLGLDVVGDPENALAVLPADYYDLVTAWEVIEHLRRPREILERLARVLKPGGVLCVSTPNLRCWRHYLQGGRWFNIVNPTHLAFFNRRTLERLLRECGFERVVRPIFWGGRPGFRLAASLAQYVARLAGIGSDLRLYAERPF